MKYFKDTTLGNIALGFVFTAVIVISMWPFAQALSQTPEGQPVVTVELVEPVIPMLSEEDRKQIECLAINSYHEARNEPYEGVIAVSNVVLNRVADERFPDTPCEVVYQRNRRGCQFSWYCDGRSDYPANRKKYEELTTIAEKVYTGKYSDVTEGANFYHATYVRPRWRHAMERKKQIGLHVFYEGY